MLRLACFAVLLGGCDLYFPKSEPEPDVDGGTDPNRTLDLPCIRTVSAGDLLPDGNEELFVTHGCEGGPTIVDVTYSGESLVSQNAQADFQLRFQRTVIADLDRVPPRDIVALDSYSSGWSFRRREFSGRSGESFSFERDFDDLTIGDLDGDGGHDVVVAGDGGLRAMMSTSSATTGMPPTIPQAMETILVSGSAFTAVAIADLGGSAAADLCFVAALPAGGYELGTAIQTTSNPFAFDVQTVVADAGPLQALVVSDVDGDGQPDVIGLAGRLFVRGSKHGTIVFLAEPVTAFGVGDVDGDGLDEPIVLAGGGVRRVSVDASGTELSLTTQPVMAEDGDAIHVVKLDADQRDDIVLVRDLGEPTSRLVLRLAVDL